MLQQRTQPTQLVAGARPAVLTSKEHLVVRGLARGRAPKQLAGDCGVSLATIRCHIQSAKRKTSARTLPELVAIATRREVMG
jgi:two-component system nitrate/nitrite response regulator NarL